MSAAWLRLQSADAAHHNKVADVLLDVLGDTAEFGVEVRRAGDEALRLGDDLRRRVRAVGLKISEPLADGAPLIVLAVDGGIAPLDGHARGEGRPFRTGAQLAQVEGGHIFDLPAPMVGRDLDRLDGRESVPRLGVGAAGGQVNFEGLEDDGDAALKMPGLLLDVGLHQLFGLADYDRANIDGRGVGDSCLTGGEHDGNVGIAHIDEVGVLGLILLFIGGDGPGAKVVDLLVNVVFDAARRIAPSLRLEDADGFALTLNGAALAVDGLKVLIEENHRCGVLRVIGSAVLIGIEGPLWNRLLITAEPSGVAGCADTEKEASQQKAAEESFARERLSHDQFPRATGVRVRTSGC